MVTALNGYSGHHFNSFRDTLNSVVDLSQLCLMIFLVSFKQTLGSGRKYILCQENNAASITSLATALIINIVALTVMIIM